MLVAVGTALVATRKGRRAQGADVREGWSVNKVGSWPLGLSQ